MTPNPPPIPASWSLRTHPFAPHLDASGNPIPPEILRRPLDPKADGRALDYFHDVYNWEQSYAIGDLTASAGLTKFPAASDLTPGPGTLIVLVSGADDSGRYSLRNLILYEVERAFGKKPIETSERLYGRDMGPLMLRIARTFIREYGKQEAQPTPADLNSTYQVELPYPNPDESTIYWGMFSALAADVGDNSDRPRVLSLEGGDKYDTWCTVALSAAPLFHAILVVTPYDVDAMTCLDLLRPRAVNACLVRTRALSKAQAQEYIKTRLLQERAGTPPADPLIPFGPDALDTLYTPGTDRNQEPAFPVGWLIRTLSRAIDERLKKASDLAIDGKLIRSVRDKMNNGK